MGRSVWDTDISVAKLVKWGFKVLFAYAFFYLLYAIFWLCVGLALWWYVANFP